MNPRTIANLKICILNLYALSNIDDISKTDFTQALRDLADMYEAESHLGLKEDK